MKTAASLTLYTRPGCHLCEDMLAELAGYQQRHDFLLNVVDVDSDSYLRLRYGERVPVLAAGDQEICHYRLNEALLFEYLKQR
jgi:glutaredoxin